jgi:hypothetical protein
VSCRSGVVGLSRTQGARLDRRLMVLLSPRSCQQLVAAATAPQCLVVVVLPGAGMTMKQAKGWSRGAFRP